MSETLRPLPPITRWVIMQKARHHPDRSPGSDCLRAVWFQVLFHSPPGVLFTFPSRYWFAIGGSVYLALEGGPPRFPQGSSCPVVLGYQQKSGWLVVRDSHPLWCAVPGSFQKPIPESLLALLLVRSQKPESTSRRRERLAPLTLPWIARPDY